MFTYSLPRQLCVAFLAMLALGYADRLHAAPPAAINIHGQLLLSTGEPVSGVRVFAVQFYDAETDGNPLGSPMTGTVLVSADGLFNISVEPPSSALTADEVWYSLGVDTDVPADNDATDDVFPNRIRVLSVPFALQAQEVVGVDADRVGNGMVDNTEFDALDGVTGNIQQQLDAVDTSGIAQNAADIAQNTNDIAANTTAITTNTSAIAANTTALGTKADVTVVNQNTADIAENTTDIAANTAALADKANVADVYTQTAADGAFVDVAGDTMTGALGVDAITEATADAGVTVEGLVLKDSYLDVPQSSVPGDATNKLYNVGGTLFFGGLQLGLSSFDKDSINNAGTLGFSWTDSEISESLTIAGGSVSNDSFSALSDLGAENAIGTAAGQVAAGDHTHLLQNLGGAVTDAQVANNLTIQGGAIDNDSFSALSDLGAESAIGAAAGQVAAGDHTHLLQNLGGAVTDAQVPDNITVNGVDAADDTAAAPSIAYGSDPNTGIHRPGDDQLALVAGGVTQLAVDTAEVNILGNILEMGSGTAPGTTTNKLYNTGGNLFWNGTQLNAGGGGGTSRDTLNWSVRDLNTQFNDFTYFAQKMPAAGTIVSLQAWCNFSSNNWRVDLRKNGSTVLTSPLAFAADTLVEGSLAVTTFNEDDVLSLYLNNGSGDIYGLSVSIIVEY